MEGGSTLFDEKETISIRPKRDRILMMYILN